MEFWSCLCQLTYGCMYTCVHIHMHIHRDIHYTCVHADRHTCTQKHVHMCAHRDTQVCMHTYRYTCTQAHTQRQPPLPNPALPPSSVPCLSWGSNSVPDLPSNPSRSKSWMRLTPGQQFQISLCKVSTTSILLKDFL